MSFKKGNRVRIVNQKDNPEFEGATGKIDWVVPEKFRNLGIDYRVKFDKPIEVNGKAYDTMNFKENEIERQ